MSTYKELATFPVRMLKYKYIGPTDTKGSRVKISDPRFGKSVTLPLHSTYNSATDAAIDYLLQKGWKVSGANDDFGVIVMAEFNSEMQLKKGQTDAVQVSGP